MQEMVKKEMTLEEYVQYCEARAKAFGMNPKRVKIEKIEDVLSGNDLEKALQRRAHSEPKQCHYNSGMAVVLLSFSEWEITFCEGYADCKHFPFAHCWNCLTNKETGEKRYVDFTLNKEGEAMLFNEWITGDILNLFDTAQYAFIPFDGWRAYAKKKRVMKILNKYMPKMFAEEKVA